MANSTTTILQTMEWAKKFNFNRKSAIGNYLEPALTSANLVIQTMVGAPFVWRWNRAIQTFSCVAGTQDYIESVPNFEWIEKASLQDPSTNAWFEIQPKISLGLESVQAKPREISAQIDDGSGSITFRYLPNPDKAYNASITYQQKAALKTSLSDTWGPIPDQYSYIYSWGFLAMMWLFADDPRFQLANQKFVGHLLASNQGLTQTQANIFLSTWQQITGQPIVNMDTINQGFQARGT